MWIKELTTQQSLEVLSNTHLGRLACARGVQPYVVPIRFVYKDHWLYSFSAPGQKIDWMRANPLVCVEADQIRREQWATVVVLGRYVELFDTPEFRNERTLAFNLLQQEIAMWWEHGGVKMPAGTPKGDPVFYRIKLEQITGRCGFSEQTGPDAKQTKAGPDEQEWLLKIFRHVRQT
jgi:uncharacterized protein